MQGDPSGLHRVRCALHRVASPPPAASARRYAQYCWQGADYGSADTLRCSDPEWRDDRWNKTCDQYRVGLSSDDDSELRAECKLDQSEDGTLAITACQLACKSTMCALPENCKDSPNWRHERVVGHGEKTILRCADYAVGKPSHRACCAEQGTIPGNPAHLLARDACRAACRTCDAQLNDLEFWGTEDFLLTLLALVPLILRAIDVGCAIQNTLHCCGPPWDLSAAGDGDSEDDGSRRRSGSFSQIDSSVELESSTLKLSPASNASMGTPNPDRLGSSYYQLDVGAVWSGNSRFGGATGDGTTSSSNLLGISGWLGGRRQRGFSMVAAAQVTLYRLVGWHCCPPLVYWFIYSQYRLALDDESIWFQRMAFAVGMREAAHLCLTLWCACRMPLVFLVDMQATLTQKNAQQHLVICLLAPWLFLLRAARPMHEIAGTPGYHATNDGRGGSAVVPPSRGTGSVAAPMCLTWLCPGCGSVWMSLSVRERITLCLALCLGILDLCNLIGLFTGITIMAGNDDEDDRVSEGSDDMVPLPILMSFFVGSAAWVLMAWTLCPRNLSSAVLDSDDSDDESDDEDHVYG